MDRSENFWRWSLFVTCFIGHCLYYSTRKSLTFSLPTLMEDPTMKITKEDFGLMASLQMITYSIGKFFTGLLVDKYSNRKIFCAGLLACGLTNICFGVINSKLYFFGIVLANGFFQAFGWNAIAVLINQWFDKSKVFINPALSCLLIFCHDYKSQILYLQNIVQWHLQDKTILSLIFDFFINRKLKVYLSTHRLVTSGHC